MSASFQSRVEPFMLKCFGENIAKDQIERNHRFLEEAIELVQANGTTRSEARQLVDYVFSRPPGELRQEIGGVMVTLAALCLAVDEDMDTAGCVELARVWSCIEKIRAKQAAKPKHSPLPQHTFADLVAAVQRDHATASTDQDALNEINEHAAWLALARFHPPPIVLLHNLACVVAAAERYAEMLTERVSKAELAGAIAEYTEVRS